MKMQNLTISKETSLQLALLKLLACIGVVYIHSYILHWNFFTVTPEKLPIVYYVQTILSQYIARVAVPVFFSVSGYIYFAKQYQDSNWQFFCRKFKGILWPYMLWNSIAIFYIFLVQIPEFTRKFFTEYLIISNFSFSRWVDAYCGWANGWFPFLYPLWFLPYLFAAFIIVHIFRKYFYKYEWLIWAAALLNTVASSYVPLHKIMLEWGPCLRLLYAISFFTMGKLLLKYRQKLAGKAVLLVSGGVFAAFAAASIAGLLPVVKWNPLSIYAGLVFIFSLTGNIGKCGAKTEKAIIFLSGFSFLIYVTHEYIMTVVVKLVYPALPAKTFCILVPYLLIPIVLISVLVTGGWILKKLLPKVYDFLFSGR